MGRARYSLAACARADVGEKKRNANASELAQWDGEITRFIGANTKGFGESRQGEALRPIRGEAQETLSWSRLVVAEKLYICGLWQQAGLSAALDQFRHSAPAELTIAEGPLVDVHSDKFVREIGFHIARKLHRVV